MANFENTIDSLIADIKSVASKKAQDDLYRSWMFLKGSAVIQKASEQADNSVEAQKLVLKRIEELKAVKASVNRFASEQASRRKISPVSIVSCAAGAYFPPGRNSARRIAPCAKRRSPRWERPDAR